MEIVKGANENESMKPPRGRTGNPSEADRLSDSMTASRELSASRHRDQLLEWLEAFAERLKGQTNAIADEVQQVVEEMDTVELNLQNTFNSFRCLSSSQFVENHVYEEDETDLDTRETSQHGATQPLMPTESYEDEILPRYKDAVATAWVAFQRGSRQEDVRPVQPGSRREPRDLHQDGRIQILPHIIGSEEFTRDVNCGLSELRIRHHDPESDTELDRDAAGLATGPIGSTGILSEGEISGTDSDGFDPQEESLEPAVSAALDFKAMLEAALRNPSLPYDGSTSNDSLFGEFADNKFSLPNLSNNNLNDSPRTISTMVDIIGRTMSTMDESKDEIRDSTSQQSNASDDTAQLPLAAKPPATPDDPTPSSTIQDLLKNSVTQALLNQEFRQYVDSSKGSSQVGTGDSGHVPIMPGGLFNDIARDKGFSTNENVIVPNSNTGPTIPAGLFKEGLPPKPIQHTVTESQPSNSWDGSQSLPHPRPSFVDMLPSSPNQDSDSVSTKSEKSESSAFQAPPLLPKNANLHSASSSTSSGSNVIFGSLQATQLPIRGGLFDDDDDDDEDDKEDAGDLFGAPAPKVVNSQPVLRPWASQSSKGLFDDIVKEHDGTTFISDDAGGSSQEVPRNIDISPLIPQYESPSGEEQLDFLKQSVQSVESPTVQTFSGSTAVDIVAFSRLEETVSNNQSDAKEDLSLLNQSTVAATVRSSMPVVAESDDDSWSSSEVGVEDLIKGKNIIEQPVYQDIPLTEPEHNDSGVNLSESRIGEGSLDVMPEGSVKSEHLSQSLSSQVKPFIVDIQGEGESTVFSSQTAPEVPPTRFPHAVSRSSPSKETSPSVMVNNPLLQSTMLELSDAETSDSSDSAGSSDFLGIGQRQAVQNIFTGTLSASENLRPSTSQQSSEVNEAQSASVENSGNTLFSEDTSKVSSTSLPAPVKELAWPTTRTFTSLFEDDDAEEDLFGRRSPKLEGSFFPRSGQPGTAKSASDAAHSISLDQGRIVDTASLSMTPDIHPQTQPASNPSADVPFSSNSKIVGNKDDDQSSEKPGAHLSSLLFGDDEDDEDVLFGPFGGRTSRGLKSGKAASLFGDSDLPKTSTSQTRKTGKNLFDD